MKSHYPDFNVLKGREEWDEHTRSIVLSRLEEPAPLSVLSQEQAEQLKVLFATLLADDREEVLGYIVAWYDAKLKSNIGEGQREENIPAEAELISGGLAALDVAAHVLHGKPIAQLCTEVRETLLRDLQQGSVDADMKWSTKVQKAFFKKILVNAVKAYYSHPTIWSEIGYAGPAYPRGYVRSEYGLTDPWEARRHDKH